MKDFVRALPAIFLLFLCTTPAHIIHAQIETPCGEVEAERAKFKSRVDFARVDVHWYQEWLDQHSGQKTLPKALAPLEKWDHPLLDPRFPSSMHEDSYSSDVSNYAGPIPENAEVQYFHVLEKGTTFSGMAPAFNFIAEDTMVTLSFGRAHTHMLLVYVGDTMKLLDAVQIPGREYSALSLANKEKRMALFRNTMGGAYSYLSKDRWMYVPGADNSIFRVYVGYGKFQLDKVQFADVREQMQQGDILDKKVSKRTRRNTLTAIMPDAEGNVWFTSQQGMVGIIHHSDQTEDGCPKIYTRMITGMGLLKKLNAYKGTQYEKIEDLPDFLLEAEKMTPELREEFRKYYAIEVSNFEQIQNSFAVGKDGVYIVTDLALHKLRFNEETKEVELDPLWTENMVLGGLLYDNSVDLKPGHLNRGSGTSPTLMDDRFVAITDNDTSQINICIFDQKTGKLVNRFPIFQPDSSACENSIIAYKNTFMVANTYGYVDPFNVNNTPGGMNRFDYDESKGEFVRVENWPPYPDPFDAKTATPKLSTPRGLVYVFNRDDERNPTDHLDWQITALDFETGTRVFSIKPFFEEDEFDDTVGGLVVKMSLGKENYDRKVFNNLWGTFSFGPNNSLYIGTYRGFIRFSSAD